MDAVSLLQVSSMLVLNVGFCWLVGSWFARRWLALSGAGLSGEPALRRSDLLAAGMAALGSAAALLAATAVMGGVGLREACPMLWMMITSTDYGQAGCVTILAMLALLALRLYNPIGRAGEFAALLLLGVFAITRSSMGHAGEGGLWTMALAAEVMHFSAIGLWTGAVMVTGWLVLDESGIAHLGTQTTDRYLDLMSQAALFAVGAIAATGVYSAWHRLASPAQLVDTGYGITLLAKVGLVLSAIALGGYNKFVGLPAASRSMAGLRLVRSVLRIETALLLGAVLAASALISQQPPSAI